MKRLNILLILLVLVLVPLNSTAATDLSWNSVQTTYQISEYTIPANGSYIGAIKLYDINTNTISRIIITSNTYLMDINISLNSYLFGAITPVTITTNYTDYISNRNAVKSFTIYFPGTTDSLILPQFNQMLGSVMIYNDQAYWSKNNQPNSHLQPLINNPYNESAMMIVAASKNINVAVTGTDKINIDYIIGTNAEIVGASSNFNDLSSLGSTETWFQWLVSKIPFIGGFLSLTISILSTFFTVIFTALGFLVFDFDIILLTVISVGMLHGIMVMSTGNNTPHDGVRATALDIFLFLQLIFSAIIIFFTLIWKIVQSIASIKP